MKISSKKSVRTGRTVSNWVGKVGEREVPLIPCAVEEEIRPVRTSPLNGRKTINRNSTISVSHARPVQSSFFIPLTCAEPLP